MAVRFWVCTFAALGLATLSSVGAPPARAEGTVAHPLFEILAQGPEFRDLQPDSVTVLIETRIPVVCAAVFGETTAYGRIATDADMAAGGHQKHHPVLAGLKPDTTYQLRMQGVGPDGTLYVSDNYTFRTAVADSADAGETKPPGRNVALLSAGATIAAVSSNYGGGGLASDFGANNAIDGDLDTEWSSNGDGDKAWISVDLGQEYQINAIGFRTRTMGTSAEIARFRMVTDQGARFGPFDLPDAGSVHYFPLSASARRLLFEVLRSSGGNTGATEIEVYAR